MLDVVIQHTQEPHFTFLAILATGLFNAPLVTLFERKEKGIPS